MSGGHPDPDGDEVVVYAQVSNFASACAPNTMSGPQVEKAVNEKLRPSIGRYIITDIAMIRSGPSSPDPCNRYKGRNHWFLSNRRLGVWQQHLKGRQ